MHRQRVILFLIVTTALLALALGTSGVSSVAADRDVQVAVVDDTRAYVGFAQETETTNGTTNLTVTVTNRFPDGSTLTTAELTVDGESTVLVNGALEPGEPASGTVESVECGDPVTLLVSGDGVRIRLERAIDCN